MSAKVIRWKLISGLLLVFVLGILVGSLTTGFYVKHRLAPFVKDPKARKAFIMRKLTKELQLTSTQKSQIEPIVEQMIEKRREYYLKNRPQIKEIMDQGFDKIEAQLTDDQKEKLEKLREHFKKYKRHKDVKRSR
jgi:ATP-dependent Lon protease